MATKRKAVDLQDSGPVAGGGRQQRAMRQDVKLQSKVARFLLEKFAWGFISTILLQQIAALVLEDIKLAQQTGGKFDDLEDLAKAGSEGTEPQNIHRDILKKCYITTLPVFRVFLPFKDGLDHLCHMMLPHETFSAMYHNYRSAFDRYVLGPAGRLGTFWKSVGEHPSLEGHWIKTKGRWQDWYIPIATHGDEVPVVGVGKIWSKSFLTFQWCSMLVMGLGYSSQEILFWIWGIFEKMAVAGQQGTIERFFVIMNWSWEVLRTRRWPKEDWRGVEHLLILIDIFVSTAVLRYLKLTVVCLKLKRL